MTIKIIRMHKYLFLILAILLSFKALPQSHKAYDAKATYYSKKFDGRKTYSGERFYSNKFTAAHRNFPLQSLVKVINPKNKKYVIVRINDRFRKKNFIDLTYIAAKNIDILSAGVAKVKLQLLDSSYLMEYNNQTAENKMIDTVKYEISTNYLSDTLQVFYIRIASLKFKKNAQKFINSDLPKDYRAKAFIKKSIYKHKPLYKIIIGPYQTKEETELILSKLHKRYKDAQIIN